MAISRRLGSATPRSRVRAGNSGSRAVPPARQSLTALVDAIDGMVYRCKTGEARYFESVSAGCAGLTGYSAAKLLSRRGTFYNSLIYADDCARIAAELSQALAAAQRFSIEYRIASRGGAVKWVRERGAGRRAARGSEWIIGGIVEDVTTERAAFRARQESERCFRGLFENATEGIFQTSPAGVYINVNRALARIYGYDTPDEAIAAVADIRNQLYVDPARRLEFIALMREDGVVTNFVSEIRRRDGDRIWISENARAVYDAADNLLFYEGTVEDVTEAKLNQEKLEYLANHDAVTGLPNRLLMNDRLRQMMLQAQRNESVVAVALIDLDHFKLINDTFGHNQGDYFAGPQS